jgi:hypothetical protein
VKNSGTPLAQIEAVHKYFQNPSNASLILSASDRTRYAWRHMSNYFQTEQVLRDGPIYEFREIEDNRENCCPVRGRVEKNGR